MLVAPFSLHLSSIGDIFFISVIWQDIATPIPCDHDITIILHLLSVVHCFQLRFFISNSVEVIINTTYFPNTSKSVRARTSLIIQIATMNIYKLKKNHGNKIICDFNEELYQL